MKTRTKPIVLGIYKLRKDMLDIKKGKVFVHIEHDELCPEIGNSNHGAMVYAWDDGDCQQRWCGNAFYLPGQYADNKEFFQEIEQEKGTNREERYTVLGLLESRNKIEYIDEQDVAEELEEILEFELETTSDLREDTDEENWECYYHGFSSGIKVALAWYKRIRKEAE